MTRIITLNRIIQERNGTTEISWKTPEEVLQRLRDEFHFDFDPCPLSQIPVFNGLKIEWGKVNFVNPPYGKHITIWLIKGLEEYLKGKTSVFLLPSYTDVKWFHEIVLKYATEIRFIKGRLTFSNWKQKGSGVAPFASMIVVFKP